MHQWQNGSCQNNYLCAKGNDRSKCSHLESACFYYKTNNYVACRIIFKRFSSRKKVFLLTLKNLIQNLLKKRHAVRRINFDVSCKIITHWSKSDFQKINKCNLYYNNFVWFNHFSLNFSPNCLKIMSKPEQNLLFNESNYCGNKN